MVPAKRVRQLKFDTIGYWSEVKLAIIREYASAYSTILSAREHPRFHHVYIDGFSGAGKHTSRKTGEFVSGSPTNALAVSPRFKEYHFIDLNPAKTRRLRDEVGEEPGVKVYDGNCNEVLLKQVFPRVRYEDYRRGLCLLDPYGLHLDWEVIQTAGQMKSIEIFLNFPVADMNRNVLWRNRDIEEVDSADIKRMTAFWGDDSWREAAYNTEADLFGYPIKEPNEQVAEAFRQRLRNVAGFEYVLEPMPMRNSKNAIVYYLFFASQKPVARKIVKDIFQKYKNRGVN